MAEKIGNFVSDIHNEDYESVFLEKRLGFRGLVSVAGRKVESLNGAWNFGVDWYDSCRRANWFKEISEDAEGRPTPLDYDWEAWERMPVPSSWNMERPELRYFEGSGIYTRSFCYLPSGDATPDERPTPDEGPAPTPTAALAAESAGERVFLRFEGSNYRTTVFLNGRLVGSHDGGSTPFCAEITDFVGVDCAHADGARADNRIIVVVEARRKKDRVPGENTDWFNYGGIYRDLLLFRTPCSFIKDWFLRLVPDGSFSNLDFDVAIDSGVAVADGVEAGASGRETSRAAGKVRLRIPELGVDILLPVANGLAHTRVAASPRLWSPSGPKLYDVEISYIPDAAPEGRHGTQGALTHPAGIDTIRDRVGFREFRARGRELLLNGEPIYLKGICVHEDHIDKGKSTDESTIRATIRHLRELHGNFLRLAHYPHDGRFARIADEEGILLWEEVPVYWAIDFANPVTFRDAENQLSELVMRDRNRASVVIWSVGNENADTEERFSFMSRLAATARRLDGTRPVSAACLIDHERLAIADRLADELDIIGINEYYGWYDPDFGKLPRILANSDPSKPVIVCEFGGDARSGQRGTVDELFTEDKQARLYERQIEVIRNCPYIKGISPWILYDFRCPRRLNRYQEGFNRKGLIDADRRTKKLAFAVLAEFYTARGD